MIVVDTNVIAYSYIPSAKYTEAALALMNSDSDWCAPLLWRSEFRNILLKYIRVGAISLAQATKLQLDAEALLLDNEFEVPSEEVLKLASESTCTAYDCEFVALAQKLNVKLYTTDAALIKVFPRTAISLV
jgi:predicted nucleic acid-binding protein